MGHSQLAMSSLCSPLRLTRVKHTTSVLANPPYWPNDNVQHDQLLTIVSANGCLWQSDKLDLPDERSHYKEVFTTVVEPRAAAKALVLTLRERYR